MLKQAHAKQQKRQILARQEDAQPGGAFAPPRARSAGKKAGSAEVSDQVLAMSLTDVEGYKIPSVRPR